MQLLLSQKYLKDNSLITDNVDFELLTPVIIATQRLKIKPILGSNLYDRVLSESTPVNGAYPNLSDAIRTLCDDYILPAMVWFVQADSILPLKFRLMNKGLMEKSGENSQPVTTDDALMFEQRCLNKAQNFARDTEKYIQANPSLYPEYFNNTGIDKTFPDRKPFKSPFYTSGPRPGYKDYSNLVNPKDNPQWPD